MKHLIIISNENQLKGVDRTKNYENQLVITTEKFLIDRCNNFFPNVIWYGNILTQYKSWHECLLDEKKIFEKIKSMRINEKNVFKEFLGYNNYSFLDIDAVRYLSGHVNMIANLVHKLSIMESIIAELEPDNVFLYYPYTEWEEALKYVCEKNSIKIYPINNYLNRRIIRFKNNFDFIELLKTLKILPFTIKLKNLFLVSKNYFSQVNIENKFDILLFSINTKYSDIILPLSNSLKNDNVVPLVLLSSDSDYFNLLSKEKIDYSILDSYLDINLILSINSIYDQIINNYNKIKNNNELINALEDICGSFIANKLIKEIEYTIIFSIFSLRNIFIIKKIIKEYSPQLLFSTHFSENIVNSLFIGCKEAKIPTIGLHRGTSIWQPEHSIFHGDRLLVSGEQSKRIFSALGVEEDKITITGFPIFDDLLKKLKNKDSIECKVREKFNISKYYTIVTYLTQSFGARFGPNDRKNEIIMVFNAIREFKDIFLIIKLHPTEYDTEIYEKIAKKLDFDNYVITHDVVLDDILLSSKIALTKNSTTGFNALIAGCKLLTLNSINDENNFFLNANVAKNSESTEELIDNIKDLMGENNEDLMNHDVKEFIEHHFYKLDCNSISRIKKLIYDIKREN
jgi:hypothetical protein